MTQTPHDGPAAEQPPDPGSETSAGGHTDTKTAGPQVGADQVRDLGRLRRSLTDRKIAGVAGGLGRHLDVDPTLLRVAFVVLCFFGGAGFVLYGAAWLLVPEEGQDEAMISASPSTRNTALIIAGVLAALLLIGDGWWGGWGFPWPLAILGIVLFLVLLNKDKQMNTPTQGQPMQGQWTATGQEAGGDTTMTQQPPAWMPPSPRSYQPPAPKPDRGPRLFWFTIALIMVALGALGLYDVSGGAIAQAAYPALALAIIGGMLVIGSWAGRPGGLIAIGLIAALALAGSSITDNFDGRRVSESPVLANDLAQSYFVPAGSIHLDLTDIADIETLDGRTINAEANLGEIVVTVPDGVTIDISAQVDAAGEINVPGERRGGNNIVVERTVDGGTGAPELDLNLDLVFGSIEVRKQ